MGINIKHERKITSQTKIPVPRNSTLKYGEFFGRSLQGKTGESDGENTIYKIKIDDSTELKYVFDERLMSEIKKQLQRHPEEGMVKVGRQSGRLWLTLMVLAYEQYKPENYYKIGGRFTYKDIINLWGVSDGQKTRKDIDDAFFSLHTTSFIYSQSVGKELVETIFTHPVNTFKKIERQTDERAARGKIVIGYEFELSEAALGITSSWVRNGKLSLSEQKEGYLSLPIRDIRESVSTNYANFRERLRAFVGGKISGKIVLKEWMKLSDDKLRRREYCKKELEFCLNEAKKQQELEFFATQLPEIKGWIDLWQITIEK